MDDEARWRELPLPGGPWLVAVIASAVAAIGVGLARDPGAAPLPARVEQATSSPEHAAASYVSAWTRGRPTLARAIARGRAARLVDGRPPWGIGGDGLEIEEVHAGSPRRVVGVVERMGHAHRMTIDVVEVDGRHYVSDLRIEQAPRP